MTKQAIVILHGWQSNLSRWQPLVKLLRKKYRVFLPPLPGFYGETLRHPWTLNDYSRWLGQYISQKKLNKPILIGHSNGGRIALNFLIKGGKAKKLILIASAGLKKKPGMDKKFYRFLAQSGKKILADHLSRLNGICRWLLYNFIGEKDYYSAKGFLKPTLSNLLKEDLTPNLHRIKIPTLILWGTADKLTPVQDAYTFRDGIKNSQLVIYDKIGHDLPYK